MLTAKGAIPVQREQVNARPMHREPDADDRGGKPDGDADDSKGFMKLRYRKGGRRQFKK